MTTVPVPEPFQDLDAVVAVAIQREEERSPLRGVDAIAVAAIVATSHAGAELMTAASHAGRGDVERLSTAGRKYLDRARQLMSDFAATREVDFGTTYGGAAAYAGPGPGAEQAHVFNASDPEVDLCDECGQPRGAHS